MDVDLALVTSCCLLHLLGSITVAACSVVVPASWFEQHGALRYFFVFSLCIHCTTVCPSATLELVLLAIWIPPRVEGLVRSVQTFAWEAKFDLTCRTNEEHGEDSDGRSTSEGSDEPVELLHQAQGSELSRQLSFSRSSKCKGKSHRIAGGSSTKVMRVSTLERELQFQLAGSSGAWSTLMFL